MLSIQSVISSLAIGVILVSIVCQAFPGEEYYRNLGPENTDSTLSVCDRCYLYVDKQACQLCDLRTEDLEESEVPRVPASVYQGMNKRAGYVRHTRLFPCQCCAISRNFHTNCCSRCAAYNGK
ncbi:hypothetical protein KP79_PYT15629 [Mizuhopecten yessoensis]|uniref:Hepcidin n=1 Tax=Mizuhopecten yessoensis TaxID=6573 RepID=A0A210PMQ8_MIZYE|nr:hypothetical protein KP79_PYT15629 [Mizuhopecten yessoensis]